MMTAETPELETTRTDAQAQIQRLRDYVASQVLGQERLVERMLIALLADGHILVEGAPGLAKTRAINVLSRGIEGDFHRIQFTPDLLPADLTGTEIYRPQDGSFHFQTGPLFHNLVLADEINRSPAKVQSALLEAMGERQITVGRVTYKLPELFMVMATQNPIEQEGTYPLPEAQLDRFMFNIVLDYPTYEEELQVVKSTTTDHPASVQKVIGAKEIIAYQHLIRRMPIADNVVEYAVKLVSSTRPNTPKAAKIVNEFIAWGAGPRASQALVLAAKGHAAINGKYSPDMEDVQAVALPILRHRILRNFKAEAEGVSLEKIIGELL